MIEKPLLPPNNGNIFFTRRAFTSAYHDFLYFFARSTSFSISNLVYIDNAHLPYMKRPLNEKDQRHLNIDTQIRNTEIGQYLNNCELEAIELNLSRPGETYWDHNHHNQVVALYYINLKWEREWGGETLFYTRDDKDIMYASEYEPNKLILFDGEISHAVRPPTNLAPMYRFTLSLFYNKLG